MIKKILLGLVLLIVLVAAGAGLYYRFVLYTPPRITDEDRAAIQLMPLPAKLELSGDKMDLRDGLRVIYTGVENERMARAVGRFLDRHKIQNVEEGATLEINCEDAGGMYPVLETDESYTLYVSEERLTISAANQYGVLHALETLSQLVVNGTVPTVEITDRPRFPWRGIMIDHSRHWIPKDVVLRNLDAMAQAKMNVLHMHLSDDQGFRLESNSKPRLHEAGSNGKYLTQEEMKEIIAYAADRAIRIVPEFDVPGHTKSWLIAYPELASTEGPFKFGRKGDDELFSVPMNPAQEEVYAFLDAFIGEMSVLFPDPYFHIGGDEVNPVYWESDPMTLQFMEANDLQDGHDLQAYFNLRLNEIVKKHGKIMAGWEEILHPDLKTDVVIQSWKNQRTLFDGVMKGSKAILSTGWYLDHKLHASRHYSIDPLVLPNAIDIVPDSGQWRMYDLEIDVPGQTIEAQLVVFDRNPNDVFGYMALLDNRTAFTSGKLIDDLLTFSFDAGIGILDFESRFDGDSLQGTLKFGLMGFDAIGTRSGGSDMPGTQMPTIEIMRALSPEEESRILGGEAAMWSEVVSRQTIDSRIWPRSFAVAEKLWSPMELTDNVEDMYRRLEIQSSLLEDRGLMHMAYQHEIVQSWGLTDETPVWDLLEVLEEAKFYGRMAMIMGKDIYLPKYELNHVADAALPESRYARNFNTLVAAYVEQPDEQLKQDIISSLERWAALYDRLEPQFEHEILSEAALMTKKLSQVSAIALGDINGELERPAVDIDSTLSYLEQGENGIVVAVIPGLRQILMND